MARRRRYNRKRRRGSFAFLYKLLAFVLICGAIGLALAMFFKIEDIEISGNRGHSGVRSQSSSRIFIGKVCDRSRGQAVSPPYTSTGYFENAGQYHASGVSNTSLGAVLWNNTWGDDAFFESHSRQPRATLVDRCTGGFVQWRFGGDETNVPNHLGDLTISGPNRSSGGSPRTSGGRPCRRSSSDSTARRSPSMRAPNR